MLKKVAGKVAESPLGRQVKKIPAPIRKGYLAGLMVPVPGVAEAGALAGAGVWAKGAIERQVRRRTGEPYRMFGERPLPAGSLPHPAAGSSLFTSPARRLLGDLFPERRHSCRRSSTVIELAADPYTRVSRYPRLRETPEEELARDRRTLRRIAIGGLLAGGAAATIIHHGRVPKPVMALPAVPPAVVLKVAVWTAALAADGVALTNCLGHAAYVDFLGEFSYTDDAGGPVSSQTIRVRLHNDLYKGTEGAPLSLPTPDEWLETRRPAPLEMETAPVDATAASLQRTYLYFEAAPGAQGNDVTISYGPAGCSVLEVSGITSPVTANGRSYYYGVTTGGLTWTKTGLVPTNENRAAVFVNEGYSTFEVVVGGVDVYRCEASDQGQTGPADLVWEDPSVGTGKPVIALSNDLEVIGNCVIIATPATCAEVQSSVAASPAAAALLPVVMVDEGEETTEITSGDAAAALIGGSDGTPGQRGQEAYVGLDAIYKCVRPTPSKWLQLTRP